MQEKKREGWDSSFFPPILPLQFSVLGSRYLQQFLTQIFLVFMCWHMLAVRLPFGLTGWAICLQSPVHVFVMIANQFGFCWPLLFVVVAVVVSGAWGAAAAAFARGFHLSAARPEQNVARIRSRIRRLSGKTSHFVTQRCIWCDASCRRVLQLSVPFAARRSRFSTSHPRSSTWP